MRACVSDTTYQRFFTWYDDGTVVIWRRDMDIFQTDRGIDTLQQFNDLLLSLNIAPLKAKQPIELQPRLFDDEFEKELAKIPF